MYKFIPLFFLLLLTGCPDDKGIGHPQLTFENNEVHVDISPAFSLHKEKLPDTTEIYINSIVVSEAIDLPSNNLRTLWAVDFKNSKKLTSPFQFTIGENMNNGEVTQKKFDIQKMHIYKIYISGYLKDTITPRNYPLFMSDLFCIRENGEILRTKESDKTC
ncbi:hypothetical protein QU487_11755 [Crenobacter sp. SG2305]|uniref:hypothetical protein n=1 Tax=Crenobacter oryzisoli TaxID=3056844 RepID=UPI0025AAE9A6|nr:hypothetical protein [Crenobacter sp. SG2305]MDN0083419.1 hypothetical protein [Crenobacter sp. SG2305]